MTNDITTIHLIGWPVASFQLSNVTPQSENVEHPCLKIWWQQPYNSWGSYESRT